MRRLIISDSGLPNGWLFRESGKEVRELKIAAMERLINKYEVNLSAFMELNYNWVTVASLANLASWFCHKERVVLSAAAHRSPRDGNKTPTRWHWCGVQT